MRNLIKINESDLYNIIKESVNNIISELDWRTYQSASDKASDKANATNNKYEKLRRKNQANSFANASTKRFSSQYNLPSGFDNDVEFGNIVPTQGQLKNAAKRNDDTIKFYNGKSEYRDGKWQDKNNLMVTESNFKNDNRNNTHYAIHKPTGKIVFAWDYKGYDNEELKSDKKYYFLDDLKDIVSVNPKECTILTRNSCLKRGIDPKNNGAWCNQEELKSMYIEDIVRNKKKILDEGYYGKESVDVHLYEIEISSPKLEQFLEENEWLLDSIITIDLKFDEIPYEKETNYGGCAELSEYQIKLDNKIKNNMPQEFLSDLIKDIEKYIQYMSDTWTSDAYKDFNDESYWDDDKYDEWRENN